MLVSKVVCTSSNSLYRARTGSTHFFLLTPEFNPSYVLYDIANYLNASSHRCPAERSVQFPTWSAVTDSKKMDKKGHKIHFASQHEKITRRQNDFGL